MTEPARQIRWTKNPVPIRCKDQSSTSARAQESQSSAGSKVLDASGFQELGRLGRHIDHSIAPIPHPPSQELERRTKGEEPMGNSVPILPSQASQFVPLVPVASSNPPPIPFADPASAAPTVGPDPFLSPTGVLVIPFDCPARFRWWTPGALTVREILIGLNTPDEVLSRYVPDFR